MATEPAKSKTSPIVVLFMLGAVAFAAVAGWLTSRLLGETYAQEPLRPVVVAARNLAPGRSLTRADLAVAQWPVSSVPEGSYRGPDKVLEAKVVPLVPVARGVALVSAQLSHPGAGLGVAAKLEDGMRAMAIQIDSATTLARLVYPGARVDVLSTLGGAGGFASRATTRTKTILQNVPVLAVGPNIDAASASPRRDKAASSSGFGGGGDDREARMARSMVTLAVTPDQAERLVFARREGSIDLVLRNAKDEDAVSTAGATFEVVVGPVTSPKKTSDEAGPATVDEGRPGAAGRVRGGAPTEADWGLPATRRSRGRRRR